MVPFSLLTLLLLPVVVVEPGPPAVTFNSLPMEGIGADVGVPVDSNCFGDGFALSSERIGRNGRTPTVGACLSVVSSERVFCKRKTDGN